jgi:hypothetical protein
MRYRQLPLFCLLIFGIVVSNTFGKAPKEDQASSSMDMPQSLDTSKIEQIVGIKGTTKDGEYKVSVPQNDLSVVVDGYRITAPMGLTTWVGFSPMRDGAMVMGDLIVQEDEVGPVEKAVTDHGLNVTALHNHFVRDSRKVMFMHIFGMGATEQLAQNVRAVFDKVKDLRHGDPATGRSAAVENTINTAQIESILGQKGETISGVFKVTIGRPDISLTDHGMKVSSFMGFNTWAAFQGTEQKAAVAGDVAMLDREVTQVIRALVEHGIEVVAVHNHMVTETPRIIFLHYWGVGPASKLAQGLKAALDQTGASR